MKNIGICMILLMLAGIGLSACGGAGDAAAETPAPREEKESTEKTVQPTEAGAQEKKNKNAGTGTDGTSAAASEERAQGSAAVPEELEGAWEPAGYLGPRAEISGNHLIRLWMGSPVLETDFILREDGDGLILELNETDLTYEPGGKPYAAVTECRYEAGALTFTDNFPITGESTDTLYPTTNSRYGNVTIISEEILPELQGKWTSDSIDLLMAFDGNTLRFGYVGEDGNEDFFKEENAVVAVRSNSDGSIWIRSEDPSANEFGPIGTLRYEGGVLRTYLPITDVTPPEILFRKEIS